MDRNKKMNFICTKDEQTASVLENLGFKRIDSNNGYYMFLNCEALKFSNEVDISKIQYTNMLCV